MYPDYFVKYGSLSVRFVNSHFYHSILIIAMMFFIGCNNAAEKASQSKDKTPPHVASSNPENQALNVALDTIIEVNFSEVMKPETITVTVKNKTADNTLQEGSVSYQGTTATFNPATRFEISSDYVVTVSGSVKDRSGNPMGRDYQFGFTTTAQKIIPDITAPTVLNTSPNNPTGGVINGAITATFSEAMNPLTITADTFTISGGGKAIIGQVTYSDTTATFTLLDSLAYSTTYTATITTGAKDLEGGNPLAADFVWTFTTGSAPDITAPTVLPMPSNSPAKVAINGAITANFSEMMNLLSITSPGVFILEVNNNGVWKNVDGTVSYTGTTATFMPSTRLLYSTTYRATITTGAKDLAGNALAANVTWTLTTVSPWASVSAGPAQTLAIRTDGTLWAWGRNDYFQLGDGTNIDKLSPTQIGTASDWVSVSAGVAHAVALKADGTLWAWGHNYDFQLGDGTRVNKFIPTQIGTATDWVSVSAGRDHTLALKTDGTLWGWGGNYFGQLGDAMGYKYNPTKIGTANNWFFVSAENYYSLALTTDAALWAWGSNVSSQLGDGTHVDKPIPTRIGTANDWTFVSGGATHVFGLKADGTLWAWGDNNMYGYLGDGTKEYRPSPIKIGTANNWVSVSTGGVHTVAITTDGALWAWGDNSFGQLGDGMLTATLSPTRIDTANNWVSVSAGAGHTVALKTDRTLWAWGINSFGQLGDGARVNRSVPTRIP